jgi:hypothetical protein
MYKSNKIGLLMVLTCTITPLLTPFKILAMRLLRLFLRAVPDLGTRFNDFD